jgi:hypothetical protein
MGSKNVGRSTAKKGAVVIEPLRGHDSFVVARLKVATRSVGYGMLERAEEQTARIWK